MALYKELSYNLDDDINIESVKGIQFSVLGPDEILKRSVCEINRTDTYSGNKPIPNGLFDIRMGALEANRLCGTCGQKVTTCPNHMGHIKLEVPVYNAMFFDTVRRLLKCVCFYCSKLIVSPDTTKENLKDEISKILTIKNNHKRFEAYLKMLTANASKLKICGDDGCVGCRRRLHTNVIKQSATKLALEWKKTSVSEVDALTLLPEDVIRVFKKITDTDMEVLGFNPVWSRPEWLICTVLPVPPPAVRPSIIEESGQRREDDLTHKLCDIVKYNNMIKDKKAKNASPEALEKPILALQYHVFTFIDNQIPGLPPAEQRNGRRLKSVADRMKRKDGRIRGNLNAKRVDQSARSVITPDPFISIDELGIPIKVAMNLTFPETVNKYNIEHLRNLVREGPEHWPGAKYIRKASGNNSTINLKYGNRNDFANKLSYGDIVYRFLKDDDYVLFNRQPSLHKMSMMCHKAKVMPYKTFRLNVLDTPPYNADFDGDEMNLHLPQNIQTMCEIKDLAGIPSMIISSKNAKPIIEIVQDTLVGSYRLCNTDKIDDKTVANLQMVNSYFSGTLNKQASYTGREVFSMILPPSMYANVFGKGKNHVQIENSILKTGKLDKNVYHSQSYGLIPVVYQDYGQQEARRFMDNTQRLICRWLMADGFSVGISDLIIKNDIKIEIKELIKKMKQEAFDKLDNVRRGNIDNNSILSNNAFVERDIINILNNTNSKVSEICLSNIDEKTNRMINMVKSGSKGKENNVAQMIGCVGQQNVEGKRIAYGFTDRTLPHYTKYDDGPEARGFVENSFINGLTPQEVFFHAMGGREGLIDTAVKSVTGDTPIIIIEDGVAKYINIGEWIDAKLDDENNKQLIEQFGPEDANMEMLGVSNDIYISSSDEHGKVSWNRITNVSRHDSGEELFEVTTYGGRSVIVTESKSLVVWDKTQFIQKPTREVKVGDKIPVSIHTYEPPVIIKYFDMQEYFSKREYIYGTDFHAAMNLVTSNSKLPATWWNEHQNKEFLLPFTDLKKFRRNLNESDKKNEIKQGCIYMRLGNKVAAHIPEKFELNERNGIFVGIYLADGNARTKPAEVSICKDDQGVIDFVQSWFNDYGITANIYSRVRGNMHETATIGYSGLLADFLLRFAGHTAYDKHIPEIAYNAPEEFVIGILNGYFSGDGNFDIATKGIRASSVSLQLMTGISHLCSRIGVFGKITPAKEHGKLNTISIRAQWVKVFREKVTKLINNAKRANLEHIDVTCDHQKFETHNDVVLDKIVSIKTIDNETVKSKYPKAYDVTCPDTHHFSIANGITTRNTSDTGYLQRRLVKSMEDAKIHYDYTVKNANGSIIQFIYGEDGMDGTKIEVQKIPYIELNHINLAQEYFLNKEDVLSAFLLAPAVAKTNKALERCEDHFRDIVQDRHFLITNVFKNEKETEISYPIPFARIMQTAQKRLEAVGVKKRKSNIDAAYILDKIDELIDMFDFKQDKIKHSFINILLRLHLNPKQIIVKYAFTKEVFDWIVERIITYFKESIAHPGDVVGIVAAQTIGEMGTQMTLDSFHVSGTDAAVKATSGVPRLKEILSVSKNIKTPTMTIYLKDDIATVYDENEEEQAKANAMNVKTSMEIVRLCDILEKTELFWDDGGFTGIEEDRGFIEVYNAFKNIERNCRERGLVLRMIFNKEKMVMYGLRMIDIYTKLNENYGNYIHCLYSDDNAEQCVMRISLNNPSVSKIFSQGDDYIAAIRALEHNLVYNVLLKGIKNINKVSMKKINKSMYNNDTGDFRKEIRWVLNTDGTNLREILGNRNVDYKKTYSNDIREIYDVLGIEAARKALAIELEEVIGYKAMNYRHMSMLIDTITCKGSMMSIDRHGINRGDAGPLARSSFEESTDMIVNSSIFSEYDPITGVSANVMLGQKPPVGTSSYEIVLDEDMFSTLMKDVVVEQHNTLLNAITENEEEINLDFDVSIPEAKNKR
eukprot:762836-Hanusia_phi.AAC.7